MATQALSATAFTALRAPALSKVKVPLSVISRTAAMGRLWAPFKPLTLSAVTNTGITFSPNMFVGFAFHPYGTWMTVPWELRTMKPSHYLRSSSV